MKIKKLSLFITTSIILFIFGSSFYFGYKYAVFNTDFHHYSIILEPFLDIENGFKLNKDIFIQYGNGQVYLFQILSNFFDINLFTIGVVTQFLFSLKFIIFFFILRFFLDNLFSIIGTVIYYLLYTFTQTVSGDIYASFFLHLFVLLYLYNYKNNNFYLILLTSLIIFLTISFRHTYLLNWIGFVLILIFLNLFFNKEFKYENKIIFNFCIILGVYFFYLFIDSRLLIWFEQFLGFALNNYLALGSDHEMSIFERINKLIFYLLRIIRHIVLPNSYGSNYFFSVIFFSNLIFVCTLIYKTFFNKIYKIKDKNKLLFILSLISFCGSIQVIHKFEIAKFLNASFPLLIIFFYILYKFFYSFRNQYSKYLILLFIFIFSIPLIIQNRYYHNSVIDFFKEVNLNTNFIKNIKFVYKLNYPFESNNFKFGLNNHSQEAQYEYSFSNNYFYDAKKKLFKGKKLNQEYLNFYENLENDLCNYSAIYNLTFDRILHHLCDNQKIYIPTLFFKSDLLTQILKTNISNSILLTHNKILTLELIKVYSVPKFYRFNESDSTMRFFPDKIYIYKL